MYPRWAFDPQRGRETPVRHSAQRPTEPFNSADLPYKALAHKRTLRAGGDDSYVERHEQRRENPEV